MLLKIALFEKFSLVWLVPIPLPEKHNTKTYGVEKFSRLVWELKPARCP